MVELDKDFYEMLHKRPGGYSNGTHSPGLTLLPQFRSWITPPVLDLGCGCGDVVFKLRKEGFEVDGVDWADLGNGMIVSDIRDLSVGELSTHFKTVLCLDVLEHVDVFDLGLVITNLLSFDNQIISVHNGHTEDYPGVELHVTRRPFSWWEELFNSQFKILERKPQGDEQVLYLMKPR